MINHHSKFNFKFQSAMISSSSQLSSSTVQTKYTFPPLRLTSTHVTNLPVCIFYEFKIVIHSIKFNFFHGIENAGSWYRVEV